jgi:hypothetical protein
MNANCVFDVTVTGERGFAKLYLLNQMIRNRTTTTMLIDAKAPTKLREEASFTAVVSRRSRGRGIPRGTIQFMLDGKNVGDPIELDSFGHANWKTSSLTIGKHQVSATYVSSRDNMFLGSSSGEKTHTVNGEKY